MPTQTCPNCKSHIHEDALICPFCNTHFDAAQVARQRKIRRATIPCILGLIGIVGGIKEGRIILILIGVLLMALWWFLLIRISRNK